MRGSPRILSALVLCALASVGPALRTADAKGGKAAPAAAPVWSEEDGRTILRVTSPSPLKAYYAPPKDLPEGKKAELIVTLHGHGGTATGLFGYTAPIADARGAAVLACEGSNVVMDGAKEGHGWDGKDAAAVLACIDATIAKHPIDPKRVVIMGHSAGGSMSLRVSAMEPAKFVGVYTTAAPAEPSSAHKGLRVVVNLGTTDPNFAGFPAAVSAGEKSIVSRTVAVVGLGHDLPPEPYSEEAIAWILDSKAPSEVLWLPLVPGDDAPVPPDSPASKAKGAPKYRHVLLWKQGGRGAPSDAKPAAEVKAAAAAVRAALAALPAGADPGDEVSARTADPLSKDLRGVVSGLVLARYGGALSRAMAALKGGAVGAPVESEAGFHVVLRDPAPRAP